MRPVFPLAATRLQIFTATALLLVIGIALAMQQVVFPALGTFVGVVLADNEYRHELETDIAPLKACCCCSFISVGASIDFNLLLQQPS